MALSLAGRGARADGLDEMVGGDGVSTKAGQPHTSGSGSMWSAL